jgi:ferric iron reductase protein FhuF
MLTLPMQWRDPHMEAAPALSDDVFRAVDRLTVGEYAAFAGHLARPDDLSPSILAADLLDASMKAAICARFARRFQDFEPRAALSIWIKWYINVILPPALLCDLFLQLRLPLSLAHTGFIIGDDARVAAVKISGSPDDAAAADPFDRFGHLIFDHFEPLIELWSARSDITRRVLWSNVGNTFEAMLAKVEQVSGPDGPPRRRTMADESATVERWPAQPAPRGRSLRGTRRRNRAAQARVLSAIPSPRPTVLQGMSGGGAKGAKSG